MEIEINSLNKDVNCAYPVYSQPDSFMKFLIVMRQYITSPSFDPSLFVGIGSSGAAICGALGAMMQVPVLIIPKSDEKRHFHSNTWIQHRENAIILDDVIDSGETIKNLLLVCETEGIKVQEIIVVKSFQSKISVPDTYTNKVTELR